jgi:hypothetical protein
MHAPTLPLRYPSLLRHRNTRILLSNFPAKQVPYNFEPLDLLAQFNTCKSVIVEERAKYEQFYDVFQDLSKELQLKNQFKVKQPAFSNNADISQKILTLQRLANYLPGKMTEVNILEPEDMRIFCK